VLAALLLSHGTLTAPAMIVEQTVSLAIDPNPTLTDSVARMVEDNLNQMFWAPWKNAAIGGGILACLALAGWLMLPRPATTIQYLGMSDASAALPLDNGLIVVADDELNYFQVYREAAGKAPVLSFDFTSHLNTTLKKSKEESDWEGSACIGNRSFWITSHGQNKQGKDRPARHRLFAADILYPQGAVQLVPVGQPYTNLLNDLIRAPQLASYNLAAASELAPKSSNALNIEGLCATPEGSLLIGFRNPIPQGRALLVPLLNPNALVEKSAPAVFGTPILLDLGGLGIRDMTRVGSRYFLLAGSFDGSGDGCLFEWTPSSGPPVRRHVFRAGEFTAEAIVIRPAQDALRALILSDDGTRSYKGRVMKERRPDKRFFRGQWLTLSDHPASKEGLANTQVTQPSNP
jgi:hypothetical protein